MLRALVVIVFLFVVSCGSEKSNDQGTTFLLPWSETSTGELKFERVHIQTLRDPSRVEGPAAKVFVNAGLTWDGFSGRAVEPRWAKSGSLYIPRDVISGQALAVYAHFEKIFFLDQKLGITHLSGWPQQVSLRASSDRRTNNAMYYPALDVTLVTAYTLNQHPLALNRFVLGHEHFHSMFIRAFENYRLSTFTKKGTLPEKLDEQFNKVKSELTTTEHNFFTLMALNEGLADFFGYVYSNDPAGFASALAVHKFNRRVDDLREEYANLFNKEDWYKLMTQVSFGERDNFCHRACRAYDQGSRYARTLYKLISKEKNIVEARETLAQKILTALPKVAENFALAEIKNEKVDAEQILSWLYKEMKVTP